ncbi:hypothetical protein A4E84_29840 [Streptomyces qaidamensis]|uniref:Uncharacterized protein n=1 Tax=Streptomyces qaidamensis TaxID=1783515 RepID=A0A143C877_9ACTN|nr:hypothetical protein [Streptomyces qaidamensis]AMW13330.1 hypothetical protein A4E84_29840 [Streptomyces qaidamensis]
MTESTTCVVCDRTAETRTCVSCQARLRGLLAQIPEQYVFLAMSRQREQRGGDGRSSTRLHAPLPGRLDTLNLVGPYARQSVTDAEDQIGEAPVLAVLETWCQVVTEERRLTPVRTHVSTLTNRLLTHLGWICDQVWVVDFELELRELMRAVKAITRTDPRRVPLPVPCPSCEMLTLVREDHSGWAAECVLCSSVKLDERDYQQLVREAYQAVSKPQEA